MACVLGAMCGVCFWEQCVACVLGACVAHCVACAVRWFGEPAGRGVCGAVAWAAWLQELSYLLARSQTIDAPQQLLLGLFRQQQTVRREAEVHSLQPPRGTHLCVPFHSIPSRRT